MFIFILECFLTKQCWSIAHCQSNHSSFILSPIQACCQKSFMKELLRAFEAQTEVASQKEQLNIPVSAESCSCDGVRSFTACPSIPFLSYKKSSYFLSTQQSLTLSTWQTQLPLPYLALDQKFACKFLSIKQFMVREDITYVGIFRKMKSTQVLV